MRRVKISSAIFLLIGAIIVIYVGLIMHGMATDDSFSSPFKKFNQNDYRNFGDIGNKLFLLYDEGYLKVGEVVSFAEYNPKNPKVEDALSKYKSDIAGVYIVDKDVILISFGAVFQSVDGIAIRRNNAEFKNTYKGTGFDEGTLKYTELKANIFHFTAGL